MATAGTILFTLLFGKRVGRDEFGNKYYKSAKFLGRHIGRGNRERRWVIFKGKSEASKIPPYWHGWMHFSFDNVPTEKDIKKQYEWQKAHLPNLTGTDYAYLPNGHLEKLGERDSSTGDYTPWKPN